MREKRHGTHRPIERSTNGQNPPRPRKRFLSPKRHRGSTLSRIECDRKQGKCKHLDLWKRNGDMVEGTHPTERNWSHLRRRSKPPRRRGQMTWPGIPPKGMLRIQEKRENSRRWLIHSPPEGVNHGNLHIGLLPQRGRIQMETGGMTERDVGEISRPKENVTGNYTELPI